MNTGVLSRAGCVGMLCLLLLSGCAGVTGPRAPEPPPLLNVDPAQRVRIAKGDSFEIDPNVRLFVPTGYAVPATGEIALAVYVNCDEWLAREMQARRATICPVVVIAGYPSSNQYQSAFVNKARFGAILTDVADALRRLGAPETARVSRVEISSYARGYAAVREILRTPAYVDLVSSIVLADSMYAGFENPGGGDRRPAPGHVEPFVAFARQAAEGRKLFLATHCQMATTGHASSAETARYLVEQVGGQLMPVNGGPETAPAGNGETAPADLEFPLVCRYDRGGLHVWGYAGADDRAHEAHLRGMADFWRALDGL